MTASRAGHTRLFPPYYNLIDEQGRAVLDPGPVLAESSACFLAAAGGTSVAMIQKPDGSDLSGIVFLNAAGDVINFPVQGDIFRKSGH
jgi:hypothetical protein